MHHSLDRDALEQRAITAHGLYIASLAHTERVRHDFENATAGVTERDLVIARGDLGQRFATLRDLLDTLGYVPRGLTAQLPPEPGATILDRRRAHRWQRPA